MLTQAKIADHLDLTQQAVSDLIKRKILPRQKGGTPRTLDDYRVVYIQHLREIAAGRLGDDGSLDLVNERARLAKEMADSQAMKNAQRRGELVEVATAAREMEQDYSRVRTRLLALPSGHAAQIARLTTPHAVNEALMALIVATLEELSSADWDRPDEEDEAN